MASGERGPHEGPLEESLVPMRLQRYLSRSGVASRRRSEDLMSAGRVTVNGQVVTELGSKVDPRTDVVAVDGVVVSWSAPVVLALNKPVGILTTMSDPQKRPCVASLVPVADFPGLYPIGRLDKDTSGLLLFTTDGNLGHGLLHPSHHVWKTYRATVQGSVLDSQIDRLSEGVVLDDGPTAPAKARLLERGKAESVIELSIHEGRTRQVRRMCAVIGHEVLALERLSFGPIALEGLGAGEWRMLEGQERERLYSACGKAC